MKKFNNFSHLERTYENIIIRMQLTRRKCLYSCKSSLENSFRDAPLKSISRRIGSFNRPPVKCNRDSTVVSWSEISRFGSVQEIERKCFSRERERKGGSYRKYSPGTGESVKVWLVGNKGQLSRESAMNFDVAIFPFVTHRDARFCRYFEIARIFGVEICYK